MNALLELEGVSVSLSGRSIIEDASFSAAKGDFIGLIGPNGAGKSTLLKTAAGLLPIDRGKREIEGLELNAMTSTTRARRLAYLPQARPVFWSMTGWDIAALGRFAYGNPLTTDNADALAVESALKEAGAAQLADRTASSLSGGELARIHLARVLAGETPTILADEPIAALDPAHQLSVMSLLRAKAGSGCAVIAALHDLSLAARYCTRIIAMHEGAIVADGAPQDVLTTDLLRDVFKIAATINHDGDDMHLNFAPLSS